MFVFLYIAYIHVVRIIVGVIKKSVCLSKKKIIPTSHCS